MARDPLFRKDVPPCCAYCARSNQLDEENATCRRRGVVKLTDHCRFFKYDPLRRVPPKPAVLNRTYRDEDFALEEAHDN